MFFNIDIKADALPPRTVCLTYDDGPGETPGDGPGPQTLRIARYLFEQRIRATFFVIGRHAEPLGEVLEQCVAWGHILGNHTYNHPGLVAAAERGEDIVAEVERTDRLIRSHQSDDLVFLRPPYGSWRQRTSADGFDLPVSIVAERLNASSLATRYLGPINWDISGEDYDYWRNGRPAEECAARYIELIDRWNRGIVLMHDDSEDAAMRAGNRTLAVTKLVVNTLARRGYGFVGLDEIPQVRSAARVLKQVALRVVSARDLALCVKENRLAATAPGLDADQQFGVIELEDGCLALRASSGRLVGLDAAGGVCVVATDIGPRETWNSIRVGDGLMQLRGAGARFLQLVEEADGFRASSTTRSTSGAVIRWVDLFPNAARPPL